MEDKINKLKNTIIALSKKNKDEETSKYLDELINCVKENETNKNTKPPINKPKISFVLRFSICSSLILIHLFAS